jgi:hypothetical protein
VPADAARRPFHNGPASDFDIYLPERLANHNQQVFGSLYGAESWIR